MYRLSNESTLLFANVKLSYGCEFDKRSTRLYVADMIDIAKTPRHPIRVVAQRTGLTPATIRAWERRYDAVQPSRSEGGQRLYSDADLDRLSTLRQLTEAGRSISMVASLSPEEAIQLLLEDRVAVPSNGTAAVGFSPEDRVEAAFSRVLAFDAEGLERLLWRSVLSDGGRVFLDDVVGPLLKRIGAGWADGVVSPAQEHLASEVVDHILDRLIATSRTDDGPTLVVSTLPGERHSLGARLVSTAAVLDGWSVAFLGTDLPVSEIVAASRGVDAAAVAISVVGRDNLEADGVAVAELRRQLDPKVALLVGGAAAKLLDDSAWPNGIWVQDGLRELPPPPPGSRV